MIVAVFVCLGLLIVIYWFLSQRFSPVPYFPSNKKDLPMIIDALQLRNKQVVVDCGAGDGIVVFAAASVALKKRLQTKFVAMEINPVLVFIMHLRRLFHPNRKNITILRADIFSYEFRKLTTDNRQQTTIYVYISPWLIPKLFTRLKASKKPMRIVSYFYPVKGLKPTQKLQGIHSLFTYTLP